MMKFLTRRVRFSLLADVVPSCSLKTDLRFARPKIRGSTERAKRRSDENVVKTLWNPTAWWSE
jgi:hypothetical protein